MTEEELQNIAEMDKWLEETFEENYLRMRMDGGHALTPDVKEMALEQVKAYYRKLRDVAENVTDTEVRLTLPGQQTDDGTRLVGVKISEEWLRDLHRHFGLRADIPTTAPEILRIVDFEKNTVNLIGDITIRTARFQGTLLTEVCPSTFEQIRELRGMGLINIVQHGKQRFFLPQESPLQALERILALYPPVSTDIDFLPEMERSAVILETNEPIELPGWLIEPDPRYLTDLQVSKETLFLS